MKLTHFASVMALGLVGTTSWFAWDSRNDARSARNRLELFQRQTGTGTADAASVQARENQILMQQMAGGKGAPASAVAPASATPQLSAPVAPATPIPLSTSSKMNLSHVGQASLDAVPPPLSSRQRLVMSLPAIGKVTDYQQQYGFVVITAGSSQKLEKGMTFAVRRGPGIVGRIRVDEIENNSAVANIDSRSVPAGVEIQVGDDVIQDLPPEA